MNWLTWVISIILSVVIILLLSTLLFANVQQIILVTGNSMSPTWDDGCKVVPMDDYTGQDLEDKIIAYESDNNDALITHRVIEEYESYNPDKHNYQLTSDNETISEDYTGEHIIIAQGDNNTHPDAELIQIDSVEAVYTSEYILQLSQSNNHPLCTI